MIAFGVGTLLASGSPEASPFLPAGSAPAPVAPAGDADLQALELAGISIIGDQQQFNFVDTRDKNRKSAWVTLGKALENGVTVESYDAKTDTVVIRKGGMTRQLGLRESRIAAAVQPAPARPPIQTAPGVPAKAVAGVDEIKNPKTPQEIKQAEFEARMLVSDLLEISMQERARQRALREQQAKQQPSRSN